MIKAVAMKGVPTIYFKLPAALLKRVLIKKDGYS